VILFEDGPVIEKEHLYFILPTSSAKFYETHSAESVTQLPSHGLESELQEIEKRFLLRALQMTKQNKSQAAKLLKLSGPSFYYRLEKQGLN